MTPSTVPYRELDEILAALCDNTAGPAEIARLESLADDADALSYILDYLQMDGLLRWENEAGTTDPQPPAIPCSASSASTQRPNASLGFLGGLFQTAGGYVSSGWPVAYLVATVIVGLGLVVGAVTHISHPEPVAGTLTPAANREFEPAAKMQFVGRITGMVDCQWSDPTTEAILGAYVPLGRKYALSSGLMEITYDHGAKVILQGPVTYEVESPTGGYLSVGKLTARLEKKVASGQWPVVSGRKSASHQPLATNHSSNPQSLIPSPLFSVRTPTALVTDLGTEFGVEVDRQGKTESHVFQGKVELRVLRPGGNKDRILMLGAHESVRVEPDADLSLTVQRITPKPEAFVRRLVPPRRAPIKLFNTGVGLKEGQIDPHWQLVAVSNEPEFTPRPALVSPARVPWLGWLENEPGRSQWISIVGDGSAVPNGSTFTFRTSFDLAGLRPGTAMLYVQFIADNCVRAIRLNGGELQTPEQGTSPPFNAFRPLTIRRGFVEGINVLEFDVENINEAAPEQLSADRMGLRVELEGTAIQQRPTTHKEL